MLSCRQQTAPPQSCCSKDVTAHPHRPGARPGRPCPVPDCNGNPYLQIISPDLSVTVFVTLQWCCVIVELPHHKGGLGITPLPVSGMTLFHNTTVHLVSWLGSLPHAPEWVAGQNLADPTTWNNCGCPLQSGTGHGWRSLAPGLC